mmetsp:Transcript_27256/g.76847  ORF Transcript_27256/g.76847 Transcript_27256/m.76847 type:complete len:205 (+) Transcript_27256:1554-2168(+)
MPLPLSTTFQNSRMLSLPIASPWTTMRTKPSVVNLTLFQQKLARICWMRPASPTNIMLPSSGGSSCVSKDSPFSEAARVTWLHTVCRTLEMEKALSLTSSFPSSSLLMSRMPSTVRLNWSVQARVVLTRSCSSSTSISVILFPSGSTSLSMECTAANIPLTGLRISWHRKAMCLVLAWAAASAAICTAIAFSRALVRLRSCTKQ